MNDTTLDFTALIRAIQRLSESIDVIESFQSPSVEAALHRTLMSGVIQHFEFTYEWRGAKKLTFANDEILPQLFITCIAFMGKDVTAVVLRLKPEIRQDLAEHIFYKASKTTLIPQENG